MSKKRKFEIHQDDELAQIDEELDLALEQLDAANVTVGGLLEEMEAANKQYAGTSEPGSLEEEPEKDAKNEESTIS